MVFFKKKSRATLEMEALPGRLHTCEEKQRFLLQAIRTILALIKAFALDLQEIDVKRFKKDIDNLTERFVLEEKTKKIQSLFEKQEKSIRSYINRQNEYLSDREHELRDIINLLTKAVATLGVENENYNQRIYEQSEKIEQITLLDDIKEMKNTLKQEIEQMRATVKEKQAYDRKKIETLSNQVSLLEVELEKAQKDSLRDGLTGVYNRQAFDRYMTNFMERSTVRHPSFSLLILSIDNYTRIKNTYGNQLADRVVLAVAQECGKFIQNDEFLARYREEVFAIILPGESLRNASKKAKHMSKAIAANRYSVSDVQNGHVLSFTVSIGVSAYRKGDTVTTVTERADEALGAAKRSGKNPVVSEKVRQLIFVRAVAVFKSMGFYGGDKR